MFVIVHTPEKRVMFDTDLPKALAVVPIVEIEFDGVFVEAIVFRMQFDEKLFPLETYFTNFRPGKSVDFRIVLKY